MKIPYKYDPSHSLPIKKWAWRQYLTLWNSIPNILSRPYISKTRFAFVCGCGHSGTTLLAARLGKHSEVLLIGRETRAFLPTKSLACSHAIASEWDYFAKSTRKSLILEKTPKHILSVKKIRALLPQSKIIAITRNPLDNIASLYRRFGNLEASMRRWICDNGAIVKLQDAPYVKVIRYEDLTLSPRTVLNNASTFLGLAWEPPMLEPGRTAYDNIPQEGHMTERVKQVSLEITPTMGSWKSTLSEKQARSIKKRTESISKLLGYD